MKRFKLLFNVIDMALTVALFLMITGLVCMEIIIRLINTADMKGQPCLYDAFINVQKYDMNSAIVIRRKNVRNVWINAQINMVVAAAFFSVYSAVVTAVAGRLMTGKVCNWGEKFSRAYFATGDIVLNQPHLWLLVAAFIIDTFVCLYVSGTIMILIFWITDKQWIGFLVAIAVISFEHLSCRGFLSFYYTLKVNIFTTGVVPWKYIIYPLMLSFATALLTTVTIRRKDFFR